MTSRSWPNSRAVSRANVERLCVVQVSLLEFHVGEGLEYEHHVLAVRRRSGHRLTQHLTGTVEVAEFKQCLADEYQRAGHHFRVVDSAEVGECRS
jgi:hypothetical protein